MKTPPLTPSKEKTTSRTHHDPLTPLFPNRVIAHFDLDCFYCQVERSLDDSLKEMPTGVCQYDPFERDGVSTRDATTSDRKTHLMRPGANNSLIAVSYEARKKGVKRNMKIGEARRCCPVRFAIVGGVVVVRGFFLSFFLSLLSSSIGRMRLRLRFLVFTFLTRRVIHEQTNRK